MTVCIAAFAGDDQIVTASDLMVSAGSAMTADRGALKLSVLTNNWLCMFSADDLTQATPILARAERLMDEKAKNGKIDLTVAMDTVSEAYSEELKLLAERRVLRRFGMTMKDFSSPTRAQMEGYLIKEIVDGIKAVRLDVSLLVCGFDGDGKRHMFSVEDPGIPSPYDLIGYHAIGTGAWAALGTMMARHPASKKIESTVFRVCEAKFAAEKAHGVGQATTLFIFHKDGTTRTLFSDPVAELRKIWEKRQQRQKPSDALLRRVEELLNKHNAISASVSSTNAP